MTSLLNFYKMLGKMNTFIHDKIFEISASLIVNNWAEA